MSELERSHIPRYSCHGSGKNGDIAAFVLLEWVPSDSGTSNAARTRFYSSHSAESRLILSPYELRSRLKGCYFLFFGRGGGRRAG